MPTVTVSIGRNVGAVPMSVERWHYYVTDTRKAVNAVASAVHFVGRGSGIYDGALEDSFSIVATVDDGASLALLAKRLRSLARLYRQDSIAMTVGSTQFVGA